MSSPPARADSDLPDSDGDPLAQTQAANLAEAEALARLARAGDHPLVTSFPQGAVFTFDRELRYLAAGGLGLADVGLTRELLEGKTIFEAFPEETSSAIEPFYRAALAGETTTIDVPYEGHIYSQRLAPVRDAGGRIIAGLGYTQDVTEARAAEHALRMSEERNRLTFENAPIGEALVELDGRWRQVNHALVTLTGYREDQLLQLTFQDITHPDDLDADLDHLNRLLAGEISSYQMEKRYFTATGRIVWVLLSVALVRDDDRTPLYFVAQIQDITERKQQQEALQDLTAMLAHDLRTPTTVIAGFAEMLLRSWDRMTEAERVDAFTRIRAASASMQSILDNSLTTTTIDANRIEAEPEQVDLGAAVLTALRVATSDRLRADTSGLGRHDVWVDPTHLSQILTNLVTNAEKYGGERLLASAERDGDTVVLRVEDDGPGVRPEFVPHLFDRFSRAPEARHGPQRGTGLGLAIVRDLLDLNGGSIRYYRADLGGAGFEVRFPGNSASGGVPALQGESVGGQDQTR